MTSGPDRLRVAAAFALPLVLVASAGWFAWSDTRARAEGELMRTADGAAEYSERIFHSALLAARLTDSILDQASDAQIARDEQRYHALIAEIMPELPVSNAITVSGRDGWLLLMSTVYPVPPISVADREWVDVLSSPGAPPLHVGALSFGRVFGNPFFSVSIPRNAPGDAGYEGLINVSLDPLVAARGLATTTHEPADVLSMIRSDGQILASTGSGWIETPRVPETSPLHQAMNGASARGMYEGQAIGLREGLPIGQGLLIAYRQVGDLPVYTTVSRPIRAILAPWLQTMARLLAVGLPASLALGLLTVAEARRREALQDSEAELRAAFENATTGTALVDGKSHRILKANRRLTEISGRSADDLVKLTLGDLVEPPGVRKSGPLDTVSGARKLPRPDGGLRWVEIGTAPVHRARRGAASLLIATIHDVTQRKEDQEHQLLLAREVDHRAKNVLAIVQAVIRLVRDPAAKRAMKDVEGRIQALARAHELMSSDRWEGAGLKDLIRDELAAYGGMAQITIEGPPVKVASSAVQPLCMALHELATNAVKHGGLAAPRGRLDITWEEPAPSGVFRIRWKEETGGAPSADPRDTGSGMAILKGSIDQIGGSVEFRWDAAGLVCTLELPSSAFVSGVSPFGGPPAAGGPGPDARVSLAGLRVLLAEDEQVVAMDMAEMLRGLGCDVIGPARGLEEAESLAREALSRLDVAILDVNLNGQSSVGFARRLSEAGVPSIFVTGYSALPGEADAEGWSVLRKPVAEEVIAGVLREVVARTPPTPGDERREAG